jgi:hypothetical protein
MRHVFGYRQAVERAHYALPKDVPPLQHDPVANRRWFLSACFGGLGLGAAACYALIRGFGDAPPHAGALDAAPADARLEWARGIAEGGDVQTLVAQGPLLLSVAERHIGDRTLAAGVVRLARECLDGAGRNDELLARQLLRISRRHDAPSELARLRPALAAHVEAFVADGGR